MFPKSKRIPRKMFPLLSDGAKTLKNNLFFLKFVSGNDVGSRFCFSVSKKVAKSAVVRNRIRRSGYRLLLRHISKIKPKILAVFSFRTAPKDDEEIIKNLESILRESKLIK